MAQGEVLQDELAVAAAKEWEETEQMEEEGDHRARILARPALTDQPTIRTYGYSDGFVLACSGGKGPLRVGRGEGTGESAEAWRLIHEGQFAFADPDRVLAEDLSHSSSEKRYYCFGQVDGWVMTVRFTYRGDVIRIFGAGYWRKGKETYEREHQVHGRTSRKTEGRS